MKYRGLENSKAWTKREWAKKMRKKRYRTRCGREKEARLRERGLKAKFPFFSPGGRKLLPYTVGGDL